MKKKFYVFSFLAMVILIISSCADNSAVTNVENGTNEAKTSYTDTEFSSNTSAVSNSKNLISQTTFLPETTDTTSFTTTVETSVPVTTTVTTTVSVTTTIVETAVSETSETSKTTEATTTVTTTEPAISVSEELTTSTTTLSPDLSKEEIFKSGWIKADITVDEIIFDDIDYDEINSKNRKRMKHIEENEKYAIRMPIWTKYKFKKGDELILNLVYNFSDEREPFICAFKEWPSYQQYEFAFRRCEEFQKVFYIKDGNLALDEMREFFGLEWSDMESPFFSYSSERKIYGLWGCYNKIDDNTGEYVYGDGMSCDKLIALMHHLNDERKAYFQNKKDDDEDNTTFFNSLYHNDYIGSSMWVKITINDFN